jgi:hypothetical protein
MSVNPSRGTNSQPVVKPKLAEAPAGTAKPTASSSGQEAKKSDTDSKPAVGSTIPAGDNPKSNPNKPPAGVALPDENKPKADDNKSSAGAEAKKNEPENKKTDGKIPADSKPPALDTATKERMKQLEMRLKRLQKQEEWKQIHREAQIKNGIAPSDATPEERSKAMQNFWIRNFPTYN